jgi:hypothetical protein
MFEWLLSIFNWNSFSPVAVPAAGVAIVCVLLLRRSRKHRSKTLTPSPTPHSPPPPPTTVSRSLSIPLPKPSVRDTPWEKDNNDAPVIKETVPAGRSRSVFDDATENVRAVKRSLRVDVLDDARSMPLAAIGGFRKRSTVDAQTPLQKLEVERGKLVEKIPREMIVGVREAVEIRLGPIEIELPTMGQGLVGRGTLTEHPLDIVETMSVELLAPGGTFEIESASPTMQLVKRGILADTPYAEFANEWGKWIWYVTPKERGTQPLAIRISASVLDSRGVPTNATLPDKQIEISVAVNIAQSASSLALQTGKLAAGAIVTGVVGGLVGAATRDYWWPIVRLSLQQLGWI